MQPDTLVRWRQGNITLTGRIVHNGGNVAEVRANGQTYEVDTSLLKVIKTCLYCGGPINTRHGKTAKYCSRQCYMDAGPKTLCANCGQPTPRISAPYCCRNCFNAHRYGTADQEVFTALVEYKRQHDGLSPSLTELAKLSLMHPNSVARALDRMEKAGRIWYEGSQLHRGIGIAGGKWTYEEPAT